jgi:glutathione S-transferase
MNDTILYYAPGACSRVTMVALEEIGLDYEAVAVDIVVDKARTMQSYLPINPGGEVPALAFRGRILTQNAAIVHYLAQEFPAARLLPDPRSVGINAALEDLVWCSCTLHILRRQVLNPPRFTVGVLEDVRTRAIENWQRQLERISARLAGGRWWYGDEWSIVDAYIDWSYTGSKELNIDWLEERLGIADRPGLAEHAARLRARPSFMRALERERTGRKLC